MSTPLVSDDLIDSGATLYATEHDYASIEQAYERGAKSLRDIYEAELQSLRERISRIDEAATNVLNRWDSPNWEWDKHGHTAGLMADLRNALDRLQAQQSNEVPLGAIMEAVAEGMNKADDAGEDPMSWIQSCVSRIRGVSDITDAERLPVVKLKPQQPNAEPVAWMSDDGETISAKRHEDMEHAEHPLLVHYAIPLYAHPPASTEPRLTVEQAMEAWRSTQTAWNLDEESYLRDRLSKAAKP